MNQEVLDFVIEATIFELKEDASLAKRVKRQRLIDAAWARLRKAGFLAVCSRCGGTGEHSYNQRDGRRCFKCAGSKWMVPRFTRQWRESVTAFDWRGWMDARKRGESN